MFLSYLQFELSLKGLFNAHADPVELNSQKEARKVLIQVKAGPSILVGRTGVGSEMWECDLIPLFPNASSQSGSILCPFQ
jgi:hypothetical protein